MARVPGRDPDFDKAHIFGQKTAHFFSRSAEPQGWSLAGTCAAARGLGAVGVGLEAGRTGVLAPLPAGAIRVSRLGAECGVGLGTRPPRPACPLVGLGLLIAVLFRRLKLNAATCLLGRFGLPVGAARCGRVISPVRPLASPFSRRGVLALSLRLLVAARPILFVLALGGQQVNRQELQQELRELNVEPEALLCLFDKTFLFLGA